MKVLYPFAISFLFINCTHCNKKTSASEPTQTSSEVKCVDVNKKYTLSISAQGSTLIDAEKNISSTWSCKEGTKEEKNPPCCDVPALKWVCTQEGSSQVMYWLEGGFAGQRWVEIHPEKDSSKKEVEFYCQQ